MVGILCGAYSSVCITGPLWLVMKRYFRKTATAVPAVEANVSVKENRNQNINAPGGKKRITEIRTAKTSRKRKTEKE